MSLKEVVIIDEETRKLYCKGDYEFFLKHHAKENSNYDFSELYRGYNNTMTDLKRELKKNKKQQILLLDSYIRKMHSGGLLPNIFNITRAIGYNSIDLYAEGENLAYFKLWQKYEKRKILREKFWDIAVKFGAILGFVLSIIKIIELIKA